MGLDFAIDALYATEFKPAQVAQCATHKDGRAYPTLDAVNTAFTAHGTSLTIRHVQLFDCFRAEWRDHRGQVLGAVVGSSAEEAGVYALALLRRQSAHPGGTRGD